ncbi:MAG: hypothetical protein AAFR24_21380 [Cyanobacteria bacterium J06627_3]
MRSLFVQQSCEKLQNQCTLPGVQLWTATMEAESDASSPDMGQFLYGPKRG